MTASGENNQSFSILSALKRAIPARAMAAATAAGYVNPPPAVKVFVTSVVFKKSKSQVCTGAGRSFLRDLRVFREHECYLIRRDDLAG